MKKFKENFSIMYWTNDFRYLLYFFFLISNQAEASVWNNLNCPAPRAPDNGLSFIFRNGELVHFRCHPGYVMSGKPVAYCVNNVWTEAAPECVPIQKWQLHTPENDVYHYHNRHYARNLNNSQVDKQRELFNWGDGDDNNTFRQSVYGDGPRRLPLINGIWPSQDHREQVLALGPQSTPGPKTMVKEEIDIAELRNKQLEELKKQRYSDSKGKRKQRNKSKGNKKKNISMNETISRETVLSLGNTEDGEALSIAFTNPTNKTENIQLRHKHRHPGGGRTRKHHGEKKSKPIQPVDSGFIISRTSRVDTSGIAPYHTKYQFGSSRSNEVAELRRRPVEQIHSQHNTLENTSIDKYDTSCVEPLFGREVPMIAPQVPNAFVFRYETKKNKQYPFNNFMLVKYRCLSGYVFANARVQTLYCKEASWVGEIPRCVRSSAIN